MAQRVCLVSGGTGGHLMPALVLARALLQRGHEPVLVTEGREVEREFLRRELPDVTAIELPATGASRWSLPAWTLRATAAARRLLREHAVDHVVSTGGRPSLPVGLAARSLGLPLYLLEQNAVVGRANRWLLPWCKRIYLGLPSAAASGRTALVTGTPLRPGLGRIERRAARQQLGLPAVGDVVLVTGGSQGARVLNEAVPRALVASVQAAADRPPLHVLHLAGLGRDPEVRRAYAAGGERLVAQVRPVALDMDRLYAAADLVICRGGGTTVAELCAVGRAALIVPYPHHKDRQQTRNAEVLAAVGAAVIAEEAQLTDAALLALIDGLLHAPERLAAMGAAARRLLTQDATAAILADMNLVDVNQAAANSSGAAAVAAPPAPTTVAAVVGATRREASA
jgi:UDP-N-acetylglucosamine--N-acetylmuramyl-(pentapeptide) pyrophosphoryl-undecaprenol N-acetylglucosamine transferase